MAPQVEDAAALEAPAKQGAGQLRPGDHSTLNGEPPEVVESLAFYRVSGESQRPVWESLSTRRHQREPGRRPRKIEGKHFDAAQAACFGIAVRLAPGQIPVLESFQDGEQQGTAVESLRGMSGSSILGNGEVALIFDVASLGALASSEPRTAPVAEIARAT